MRQLTILLAFLLGGIIASPSTASAEDSYDDSMPAGTPDLSAENIEHLKTLMNQMQNMSPEELNAFLQKIQGMTNSNDTSSMQDLIDQLQNQTAQDNSESDETDSQSSYEPYKTLQSPADRYQTRQSAQERFNKSRSNSRFGSK